MSISYKKTDEELKKIISLIKISKCITPLNDSSERKKFLDEYSINKVYNPQYIYQKKPNSILNAKAMLFRIKDKVIDKMHKDLINKLLLVIEFIENINNDNKQIFTNGVPSSEMIAIAKLSFPFKNIDKTEKTIGPKAAKKAFLEYIRGYGINDWNVKVKKIMVAKANVDSSKKTIFIKNKNYSLHELNNLISHEIEVHVLRAFNGEKSKNILFSLGTADYLKTEEGLAIMMEQLSGNHNPLRFKFFAARAIAADLAITKSFYEVFNTLHKKYHLSKHNAYIITKRVKRGLRDTSKPGGYIKDHVYFEGFYMIKKFMQNGGDIRPLFIGKISLSELPLVKDEIMNTEGIIIPKAVEAHYEYLSKQKVFY